MARVLVVEDSAELALVVASALVRRGHIADLVDSVGQAKSAIEQTSFDAAVIDLLLPDGTGLEILDLLASRQVPAVAVSGVFKGEALAKDATERHGARAFFEKPFDLEQLMIELERWTGPAQDGAQPSTSEDGPDIEITVDDTSLAPLPQPTEDPVGSTPTPSQPLPTGSLAQQPVFRLLTAAYQSRHHGALAVRQDDVRKVIYFLDGQPTFAASSLEADRFLDFATRELNLSPQDVDRAAGCIREGTKTGDALITLKLCTPEQRDALVTQQVKEIIWSTFPWRTGFFRFIEHRTERALSGRIALFPGTLILEGVEKYFSPSELRRRVRPTTRYFPTADPPYELHQLKLSEHQARLLAYADGTKTVADLLATVDLPEQAALAALCGFEAAGLIEERSEHAAPPVRFGL